MIWAKNHLGAETVLGKATAGNCLEVASALLKLALDESRDATGQRVVFTVVPDAVLELGQAVLPPLRLLPSVGARLGLNDGTGLHGFGQVDYWFGHCNVALLGHAIDALTGVAGTPLLSYFTAFFLDSEILAFELYDLSEGEPNCVPTIEPSDRRIH